MEQLNLDVIRVKLARVIRQLDIEELGIDPDRVDRAEVIINTYLSKVGLSSIRADLFDIYKWILSVQIEQEINKRGTSSIESIVGGCLNKQEEILKKVNSLDRISNRILNKVLGHNNLLEQLLKVLVEFQEDIKSLSGKNEKILELVESAKGSIAVNKVLRERKERPISGEDSPRFRKDAPTADIVDAYNKGVPISEIAKRYNMTYAGIIYRLKCQGLK